MSGWRLCARFVDAPDGLRCVVIDGSPGHFQLLKSPQPDGSWQWPGSHFPDVSITEMWNQGYLLPD